MALSAVALMAKAKGFTNSISRAGEDHRRQNPSASFGQDYNRLRTAVLENFPALSPLLPPEASIEPPSPGYTSYTKDSYNELDTYCEQLYQLLETVRK
jgi:hypothetical protein